MSPKKNTPYSVDDWRDEREEPAPSIHLDPLPRPSRTSSLLDIPSVPSLGFSSLSSDGEGLSGISMPLSSFGESIRNREHRASAGYVYFIQRRSGGPIKIGHSRKPHDRIRTLQTANPEKLVFLALAKGSKEDEKKLHSLFGFCRIHTGGGDEWFEPVPELLSAIQQLNERPEKKGGKLCP